MAGTDSDSQELRLAILPDESANADFQLPEEVMQLLSEEYARVTNQLQSQLNELKSQQGVVKEVHADVRALEKKLKKQRLTQERYEKNFELAQASLNNGDFTSLCAFAGRSMESLNEWHDNFQAMETDFLALAVKVRSAAGAAAEGKQKALDARDRALWRRKVAEQIRTVLEKILPVAAKFGGSAAVTLAVGAGVAGAIANPAGALTAVGVGAGATVVCAGGVVATAGGVVATAVVATAMEKLIEEVLAPLWKSFMASGVGKAVVQAVKEAALLIWHVGVILIQIPGVPLQMALKQLLKVVTWLRNLWSREAEAYSAVAQEFGKLEKHLTCWADRLDKAADSCKAAAEVCDEMYDLTQEMETLADEAAKNQEDLQGTSAPMLTSQLGELSKVLSERLASVQQHHGGAMLATDATLQATQSVDFKRLLHDRDLSSGRSSES